jgi:hypothetical protein
MSTHPVRRFYPSLGAQRRYRRIAAVAFPHHRSQRVASDPLGILATSVQMCENLGAKRSPRTASTAGGMSPWTLPVGTSVMNSEIDLRFGQARLRTFTVNSSSRPASRRSGASHD